MDSTIVTYSLQNGIATITMDDKDKNLISPAMIKAVSIAFKQAKKDKAVVVLTGRDSIFSAGFDLKILKTGALNTYNMLMGGFKLAYQLLSYPYPVVIACNGHAIAMGVFLLLSGDYRIGVSGDYKIVANEVAIGLILPYAAIEICRQRLVPAHFQRATLLSESYTPKTSVEAGFMDQVVPEEMLIPTAIEKAASYTQLNLKAHSKSKSRVRKRLLYKLQIAMLKDRIDFVLLGIKRLFS
ncbi:MAG: crotonase/enoyl-CoA hydratase family protein [Chitinophagales bacterium]